MSEPSKKTKILYIEDNPANAKLIRRVLEPIGYELVVAETGLRGIDAAFAHKPDLILMDINLPDLSGREVTTRLRGADEFRETPIVALTAQTDDRQRAMTLIAGVSGYMTKPIEVSSFPERVEFYLNGGKDPLIVQNADAARQEYYQELVEHLERRLREVEANNTKLRQLDKIKDDFITRTAHELRTPLTIIYGYGRLLQTSPPIQTVVNQVPEAVAYIDGLVESIERLHDVVDEILTIYRITTGDMILTMGPANMGEIAQKSVNAFNQIIVQRNITLEFDAKNWPTKAYVDCDLIRLAVTNLLGNAIKYTPDGGKVTLICKQTMGVCKITVKDTGIGIPLEEQQRIFERFYSLGTVSLHSTSKSAFRGGGLGLGLSIAKSIIDAHGGKITVESAGQDEKTLPGSAFHIELPIRESHVTRVEVSRSSGKGS